jgi:hypothetical protein
MTDIKKTNILQTETDLIADSNKNIGVNSDVKNYLLGKNIL